jgi:hypothetical protein
MSDHHHGDQHMNNNNDTPSASASASASSPVVSNKALADLHQLLVGAEGTKNAAYQTSISASNVTSVTTTSSNSNSMRHNTKKDAVDTNDSSSLTNRRVMIPMTSKAFFAGTLQPTMVQRSSRTVTTVTPSSEDENEEKVQDEPHTQQPSELESESTLDECVLVNAGLDYLVEVDRQTAADILWRKMERNLLTKTNSSTLKQKKNSSEKGATTKKTSTTTSKSLKMQKGFLNQNNKKKKNITSKVNVNTTSPAATAAGTTKVASSASPKPTTPSHDADGDVESESPQSILPFLEIREELDPYGNEIKAEAIDLTQELKELALNNQEQENENAETDKEEEDDEVEELVPVATTSKPSVEQYASITSRLDQLALEEEAYDKNRAINQKSATKLQGSGWKKGFFDKPAKTNKKPKQKTPITYEAIKKQQQADAEADAETKQEEEESSYDTTMNKTTTTTNTIKKKSTAATSSHTTPLASNESVHSSILRSSKYDGKGAKASATKLSSSSSKKAKDLPQPMESKLFTGHIAERPPASSVAESEPQQQQQHLGLSFSQHPYPPSTTSAAVATATTKSNPSTSAAAPPPQKKLSRFAQRRLDEQGY